MAEDIDFFQYYPRNWTGCSHVQQRELFDQMMMYLTQHELHKKYNWKIEYEEWMRDALVVMKDFSHFYHILTFTSRTYPSRFHCSPVKEKQD
jgi:hypothetical protein